MANNEESSAPGPAAKAAEANTENLGHLPAPATERSVVIPEGFLLSVLMPVFNEEKTLETIVERVQAVRIPKEIIIVDDYSTDGTREILKKLETQPNIRVFHHEVNKGKGAALQTAIDKVQGTHVIVQDADLGYDPDDYTVLLRPLLKGDADVVYGSRFKGSGRGVPLLALCRKPVPHRAHERPLRLLT